MTDERVWVEDRDWRVPSMYGRCRHTTKGGGCPNIPSADLARKAYRRTGIAIRWYAYCGDHLYGRRIRNGRVEFAVAADSPAAERGWI